MFTAARRAWHHYWNSGHVTELFWFHGWERRLRLQRAQRSWSKHAMRSDIA